MKYKHKAISYKTNQLLLVIKISEKAFVFLSWQRVILKIKQAVLNLDTG